MDSLAVDPVVTSSNTLATFKELRRYLNSQILGQESLVESLLVTLLAAGHLLIEGPPGLAKTRAIKALSHGMQCAFQRIQFTPDMLPADLTGSDIYRPEDGSFRFQRGPLFHNLILADEINRAPAKVQSALLEAMAEQQVSVGMTTYALPRLFLVMGTQNPIEHEGTYPLPEAQLDRFMLHAVVDYPDRANTRLIMGLARREALEGRELPPPAHPVAQEIVFAARRETLDLNLAASVADYIAAPAEAPRPAASFKAFRNACQNDNAHAARRNLLAWAAAAWPYTPPAGLNELSRRLGGSDLTGALRQRDRACYADETWHGSLLAKLLPAPPATSCATREKEELPALYA